MKKRNLDNIAGRTFVDIFSKGDKWKGLGVQQIKIQINLS
jgi:hypothetical protein